MIYSLPSSDFHDVTTGSNGYSTHAGYDLVTGRGTPVANRVVNDLAGFANSTSAAQTTSNGASTNSTTSSGSTTSGGTLWWFRFSFGPPFFGFSAIASAQPIDAMTNTTFNVSSAATLGGQPTVLTQAQPTATSAESSDVVFARPIAQSYGNGVARLDWSETSDEEEELDLDFSY